MALPEGRLPDGLIIPDDHAAAQLIRVFAAAGRPPPRIAVLANRQVPVSFPAPVLAFEVDIDALADRAVGALQNRVLGTAAPTHAERVAPVRREGGAPSPLERVEPPMNANGVARDVSDRAGGGRRR